MIDMNTLPDGWEVKQVRAIVTDVTAGVSVNGEDRPARSGELGVLKLNAISNGRFQPGENKAVIEKDRRRVGVSPSQGDVLISRANGSLNLLGTTVYIEKNFDTLFIPDLLWRLSVDESQNNSQWLHYFLASTSGRRAIQARAVGSNGTNKISQLSLQGIKVARPPLPEQREIAAILSTWDRAIELTEKLIATKQKRKQALMQQLLTGKVRLSGFDDEWQEYRLGKLFPERDETGRDDLPLLSITSTRGVIRRDEVDRKDTSNKSKAKYKRICVGDIGYNTMRMWQGVSALSNLEGIVSPAYTVVVPGAKMDGLFTSYFFKYRPIVYLFYRYSQGLVSDTWNLKYHHFSEIRVRVPSVDEQREIAKILECQDMVLKNLNERQNLLEQQKKGLMQRLLTGKTRVKVAEEVTVK